MLKWELELHAYTNKNGLILSREGVSDKDSGEVLLLFEANKKGFVKGMGQETLVQIAEAMSLDVLRQTCGISFQTFYEDLGRMVLQTDIT